MNACPALFVSAPASGQGKTTVTAAVARYHRRLGRRVRVFKTGPDFLDPMVLERASGHPVYQLDLWMGGADHCRELLHGAAAEADLILIEGVMGLFDGAPSSCDLARLLDVPVLAVIDASAMAQTFGAVAHGLARYRDALPFAGVFANRVAGRGHEAMLRESLPADIAWYGALPIDERMRLPDRHLGLVQAQEIEDLERRLERAADAVAHTALRDLPPAVPFAKVRPAPIPALLAGQRIAVARDRAFAFVYPANLALLERLGAELEFFSPLRDVVIPPCDSVYLPGGYPELHLDALETNLSMAASLHAHHRAGKPMVAECGGLLYLMESLTDAAGRRARMVGLLRGRALMQTHIAAIALQQVSLPEGTLRGHTFHHSRIEDAGPPATCARCPNGGKTAEAIYRVERTTASYVHLYLPSNARASAALFTP